MNLDNNATYILTKIGIKDTSKSRMVQKGDTAWGEANVIKFDDGQYILLVGRGFNIISTSPVQSFVETNGNFMIETLNSTYSLQKVIK